MPEKKFFFANNSDQTRNDNFRDQNGRVWRIGKGVGAYLNDGDSDQKYSPKIQKVIITKKKVDNSPILPVFRNSIRVVGNTKDFADDLEWEMFVKGGLYTSPDTLEAKQYNPLVNLGRRYREAAFDYVIPLDRRVTERMADSMKAAAYDFNFEYNFYDREYELYGRSLPEFGRQVNALPNLNLISFLKSADEEEVKNNPVTNIVFNRSPGLKKAAEKALLNFNKGKKDPDRSQKNFDKFFKKAISNLDTGGQTAASTVGAQEQEIVFDKNSVFRIINGNSNRFFMPMYVNLQMTTDDSSVLSEILSETDLLIDFLDYAKSDQSYNTAVSGYRKTTDYRVQNLFLNDEKVTQGTRLSETSFPAFELMSWWNTVYERQPGPPTPGTTYLTQFSGMGYRTAFDPNYSLVRNLNSIKFLGHLRNYIKNFTKDYNLIFEPNKTKVDTIAYEIIKYKDTPDPANIVKKYVIPNLDALKDLNLVDSQVIYDKVYVYEVRAICVAVTTTYTYSGLSISRKVADDCIELYDQASGKPVKPRINSRQVITSKNGKVTYLPMEQNSRYVTEFDVQCVPSLRVFRVPLCSYRGRMVDDFSTSPNIEIVNLRDDLKNVKIMLSSNSGALTKKPIAFSPSENDIYNKYKRAKNLPLHDGVPITFNTDDNPVAYEIYRMDTRPSEYSDFFNNQLTKVSTALVSDSSLIATAVSYIDRLDFDKKYYYIFRSIDVHGKPSYPSPIYEVELVNISGGVYLQQRVIEFSSKTVEDKIKTMKRFIQVVPNERQRKIQPQSLRNVSNNPGAMNINLGIKKEKVWDQRYKLRLTSTLTGKKIDINFVCKHKQMKYTEEET